MSERKIGSDDSPKRSQKILGSDGEHDPEFIGHEEIKNQSKNLRDRIVASTSIGQMSKVPSNFDEKEGDWITINSDNLFEVLYLDYLQYENITPDIILNNYTVIAAFWKEKDMVMMGGVRERIYAKYGEETIKSAAKKLKLAYDQLNSKEGINLYYRQIDTKRYNAGLAAIKNLVEVSLADGELTRQEANAVIRIGVENGLTENEVHQYLLELIKEYNFKPRSTKTSSNPFDNRWMTDEKWKEAQNKTSTIFGTQVSSLEEVGEVLYKNHEKAAGFLKNSNYLIPEVTKLHSTDKAFEFDEILEAEKDPEKRYLKVIYHLNSTLPYRIEGEGEFHALAELYARAFESYLFYKKLSEIYEEGMLHIWLNEVDPINSPKLTTKFDYISFLKFTYSVDGKYPFYLSKEKFNTPELLISDAKQNLANWKRIIEHLKNNQLPTWFSGIGREEWLSNYNKSIEVILDSVYHTDEDKQWASVQSLIHIIDPTTPSPSLVTLRKEIDNKTIEGSDEIIKEPFTIKLENNGFVKAKITLDNDIDGVDLSDDSYAFHSQNDIIEHNIDLIINSAKLVKNQLYTTNIVVETIYDTIRIPVEIKAVFPKRAFAFMLLKYASIFMLFFAALRFGLGAITSNNSWLGNNSILKSYLALDTPKTNLPDNYFYFFIFFIAWLVGLVGSVFIIRKYEKI